MFFEEKQSRLITRVLTEISAIWMWASLLFLIDIIIIYIMGQFIAISQRIILIMLAFVPLLGVYNYYKAHKIIVKEYCLDLGSDMKIVHLSDVHYGAVRNKKILTQIRDKLNSLDADLAIISGDLADGSCVIKPDDFMILNDVKMPIIFTPGNHDFYPGIDNVKMACRNAGITVLDNNNFEIGDLNIFGLTYSFDVAIGLSVEEIASFVNPDKKNIIIYHVPYEWDVFSDLGFDLQLSGHTHGGQFYPIVWLSERMFKYNKGLFKSKNGYLSVTTGVGSMDQPMRWGTDSEMVVLKLKK